MGENPARHAESKTTSDSGECSGRAITIVGMARSGLAAAELALKRGARPFVTDAAEGSVLMSATDRLRCLGVPFEVGGHSARALDADYLVVSPGVPSTAPLLARARAGGMGVYSTLEFGWWACRGRTVAVTGTNGKTTTTSLIGHILTGSGLATEVCGNIGRPLASVVDRLPSDGVAVVEVSSYQLETVDRFRPDVAVLLNIQPDHLDRHGSFDAYRACKYKVAARQEPDDALVVNADDPEIDLSQIPTKARGFSFSIGKRGDAGTFVDDGWLWIRAGGRFQRLVPTSEIGVPGRHNLANAAAATMASALIGVPVSDIASALRTFTGVEHRLEQLGDVGGILFVNDSKATNVASVCVALEATSGPVLLVCGGRDKGAPYGPIADAAGGKLKLVVAIGEAREKIARELGPFAPVTLANTLDDAVRSAFAAGQPGDTVLLSPACSSFDQFDDFEHRGREFKAAVQALRSSGQPGLSRGAAPTT